MLVTFFLVVQALVAAILVTVILMQRSEGGGLGMGGSPSGLMSARGAADFLTRATTVLATIFVLLSIGLAVLIAAQRGGVHTIDTSLARPVGSLDQPLPAAPTPAAPTVPLADQPSAPANLGGIPIQGPTPTLDPTAKAPRSETKKDGGTPAKKTSGEASETKAAPPAPAASTSEAKPAEPKPAEAKPAEPKPAPAAPPPAATGNSSQ